MEGGNNEGAVAVEVEEVAFGGLLLLFVLFAAAAANATMLIVVGSFDATAAAKRGFTFT